MARRDSHAARWAAHMLTAAPATSSCPPPPLAAPHFTATLSPGDSATPSACFYRQPQGQQGWSRAPGGAELGRDVGEKVLGEKD